MVQLGPKPEANPHALYDCGEPSSSDMTSVRRLPLEFMDDLLKLLKLQEAKDPGTEQVRTV